MTDPLPERFEDESGLDEFLTRPDTGGKNPWSSLPEGDILILGIAGKMGVTLGILAVNALKKSGKPGKVTGVARFSRPETKSQLEAAGVECISCDLLDRKAVFQLPDCPNVIYMAGKKFGTDGEEAVTWAMNTMVPSFVAEKFAGSRMVVFSTGCVYPLVSPETGGCTESSAADPVGEYAQSCLGRERIFEYAAERFRSGIVLFRLNYAIDLRYGVLHDLAQNILHGQPVPLEVGHCNIIWQGDANRQALRSLGLLRHPGQIEILNCTGPELLCVRELSEKIAEQLGKKVRFEGRPGSRVYLNDASKALKLFGPPSVDVDTMIRWTCDWIQHGGKSFGKPTHFEINDGKY